MKPKSEDQLQALLETIERLRAEKFPHLEANLVRELLLLHADGAAADGERLRAAEQAVERRLSKEGSHAAT